MPALSTNLASLLASLPIPPFTETNDMVTVIPNSNGTRDPYEQIQPGFTYAMPVQVVVLGVTITLLGVLFVHLLFTIRYHWPLSRINYALQTSAVVMTMIKIAAEFYILMSDLKYTGQHWPFTYDYIEVQIPPDDWGLARHATWIAFISLDSLIIHMTHIQFLTMLFPSGLEAKLILILLGPLALASSFLAFTNLSTIGAVTDLGDAIRNTANSTLTLLYTLAIFIWGLTLNRSRAWRTEGGTATFGIMALSLGVCGTAINFVEVKEERMRWLPGLVNCILLWQSWVGFWWWVGSGMWAGEAEDVERKERKRLRRIEGKRRKKEERLLGVNNGAGGNNIGVGVGSAAASISNSLRRRRRNSVPTSTEVVVPPPEEIELTDLRAPRQTNPPHGTNTFTTDSLSTTSTPPLLPSFLDPLFSFILPFFSRLKTAHNQATLTKAAEPSALPEDLRRSWGLRALMMKGRKERGERRAREGRGGERGDGEVGARERQDGFELDGGRVLEEEEESGEDEDGGEGEGEGEEWESEEEGQRYPPRNTTRREVGPPVEEEEGAEEDYRGRGMEGQKEWWWKGAIARWRLKDVRQF